MAARSVTVTLNAAVGGFVAGMGRAASAADGLVSKLDKGAGSSRDAWDRTGTAFVRAGGLMAIGVGAVVKTFADFDKAMSSVAATGQDARTNMDGLRKTAIQVGADTKFSAKEAAGGMEELLKAGVSAADVMGGGLKGAMDLAAAGSLDVADASEIAATAMVQFGKSGKDVPHIADLLAAGAGKAQGSVADMGMALKQSGLVASQFGLSIEETTGTLAAFASSGLIGSDAGTSFKSMLLSLANPSKESAKLMNELGISAYDTSGNFVGIANLAEQLKTKLGGLTQQQRDQALAQIFGNDAVRAANVLYKQGAAGINDWVNQVNEQGYATRAAAEMSNNLAGDIEKLGGSFESAMIQMGEGANGALRTVVQSLDSMVSGFSKLPASVQQGTLAVMAVGAAALLGVGGFMKLVGAIADTRRALIDLGVAGNLKSAFSFVPDLVGAMRNGNFATTQWKNQLVGLGAAAAGLVAVSVMANNSKASFDKAAASAEELKAGLDAIDARGRDSMGQLDRSVAKMGDTFRLAGQGVKDTDSAFQALHNSSNFLGQGFKVLGDAMGFGSTLSTLQGEFDKMDKSLTSMKPDEAAQAFTVLSESASKAGFGMHEQLGIFDDYGMRLQQTAVAMTGQAVSAQELYDWMGGKVPAAVQAAAEAQMNAAGASGAIAEAMGNVGKSAQEAAQGFMQVANAMLALSGSQMGVEAAIDAATASLNENGKTLDITTEKGRQNRSALDNIAGSALKLAESQAAANKSSGEIGASMDRNRQSFIDTAVAMGMNAGEATRLADEYGLVGSKVAGLANDAQKGADGMGQVSEQARQLGAALMEIPPSKAIQVKGEGIPVLAGEIGAMRQQIDGMPPEKKITVTLPGGKEVQTTVGELKAQIDGMPPEKRILILAEIGNAAQQTAFLASKLKEIPHEKRIGITLPNGDKVESDIAGIGNSLNGVPNDKIIRITMPDGSIVETTAGQIRDSVSSIPGQKDIKVVAQDQVSPKVNEIKGALMGIPPNKMVSVSGQGIQPVVGGLTEIKNGLANIPPDKQIFVSLPNGEHVIGTAGQVREAIDRIPGDHNTHVTTTGTPGAVGQANQVTGAVMRIPDFNNTNITTTGTPGSVGALNGVTRAVNGIPDYNNTSITTSGTGGAVSNANSVTRAINNIPGSKTPFVHVLANTSGAYAAQAAMNSVRNVVRTVTVVYRSVGGIGGAAGTQLADGGMAMPAAPSAAHFGPGVLHFAGGGATPKGGPSRADIYPAWLAAREFVQPETATDYYGFGIMEAMRRRRIPREAFSAMGFADGGSPSSQHIVMPKVQPITASQIAEAIAITIPQDDRPIVLKVDGRELGRAVNRDKAQWGPR